MKKTILTLWAFIAFISTLNAQKFSEEFKLPTLEEVQFKQWPKDTIAEALVIYDFGESRFISNADDSDFEIHFKRTTKIKILKQSGVDYANIVIPLYHNSESLEKVIEIAANVYNIENGSLQKTEFNKSQIYQEEKNENWSLKKFTLPNVKPGSVIEYTYTIVTPFKFNLPDWEFQWDIPVRTSKYIVRIIPFYEYKFVFQGANTLDIQNSYASTSEQHFSRAKYKEMFYEFGLNNVPAFRDEEYITSPNDYIKKIDFQLVKFTNLSLISTNIMHTWEELTRDLTKDPIFGKYINASQKSAQNLSFETPDDTLKTIQQAVNYVKNNYSWNNTYSKYAIKTLKEFTTQKKGNSANINLFLVGVLRSKGIKAEPVLISTRSNGKIKVDYPFLDAFNNVIVLTKVNNKPLLLDATNPYCAYNNIPAECINEKGYIISDDKTQSWVYLNKSTTSDISEDINLSINLNDYTIESSITTLANNMDANWLRNEIINRPNELKKTLFSDLTINSFEAENLNNPDTKLKINTTASADLEMANNQIILHPFLKLTPQTTMFKAETRDYPIDLTYSKTRKFNSKITVPNGYKAISIPENFTLNDPLMNISVQTLSQPDNTIIVSTSYSFNKVIYAADEYKKLKNLFNLLLSKLNNPIILAPDSNTAGTSQSGNGHTL
jgi:transglutaminase-like putative cysteine protease